MHSRKSTGSRLIAAIAVAVCLLLISTASASTLTGRVTLTERNQAVRKVNDVVVYYRPDQPVAPEVPEEPSLMTTYRKRFNPRVLAIPVGGSVRFPNQDPILHNAFSVSGKNKFDMGLYSEGDGGIFTFDNAGLVKVYCNVHQAMVGHILVLDTPFFGKTGAEGSFRLEDIPDGPGKFYVWHERARKPLVMEVELPLADDLELNLELTKRRVPNHKNKQGKLYRNDRRRY